MSLLHFLGFTRHVTKTFASVEAGSGIARPFLTNSDEAMPPKDPCQKQACAIQQCLQANKYVESMCEDVIREMRRCCKTQTGKSVCCSGFKDSESTENKSVT